MLTPPQLEPFGDSALLVTFGTTMDVGLNARVHALAAALREQWAQEPGWGVPVPGYSSLLVPYDPEQLTYPQVLSIVETTVVDVLAAGDGSVAGEADPRNVQRERVMIDVPVRYGGEGGPDLADVAARAGLTEAAVVALHSGTLYRVFMLGFAPGFAYLGPLPAPLVLPRRATPRPRVPAGSVAIAGGQTGIYPLATPGGWHLIGHTAAPLWDAARDPPALLRPGAWVRFVPV
ncbi:MAG: 5-oxoprolinase subunit PxpB [Chloroflexota bacterium]|nr:5-oxoprolinase subunit PxpB [Chloroflexota bacterium]